MDIVTTSNFHATVLQGTIAVVFIPVEHLQRANWSLLNLLLYGGCSFDESGCRNVATQHVCRSLQAEVFSVVSDQDGVTLFMDPNAIAMFNDAALDEIITIAPNRWCAIQIHLGPMVAEFPGVISFLSKLLAEDNISILNMSTYDTDIIYVQEPDLEKAISCLQSKLTRGVHGLKEAKEAEWSRSGKNLLHTAPDAEADAKTPQPQTSVIESGQYLIVYHESLVLVRLRKDAIRENAYGLTRLVLRSARHTHDASDPRADASGAFWCYCEAAEEISLLMSESALADFAEDSIIVSPDRWRAIKLGGRQYGFDETGVVAAMSGFNTETHVLNVSSFGSNVVFVMDHTVDESVTTLCATLNISNVLR